jgi:hypothetical protein
MQKNVTNGKKSILALFIVLSMIIVMPTVVFISRALGGGTAYCSDISPTYINASSDHIELFKIAAQTNYIDGAGAYLDKVYVNFSGAGFSTSDLNPLIDGETAGVSIWVDSDNPNGDGVFNSVPDTMLIPSSIKWIGNQTRVTLPRSSDTQFTEINTNFTFYVIIRTSSTITDNDIIGATIDRIWVNASNATLMGTTTATLTADTISPSVAQNALIAPNSGEKWSGTHTISWDHTRITDSHLLATPVTCYYSSNSGTTWTLIAANEANDGSYSWDTTTAGGDGSNYKVNITAVDGAGKIGYDISNATFQIDNTLPGCTIAFNRSSTYLKDGTKLKIFANFTEGESGVDESTVKISIDTTGDGDLTNHSMEKASNTHWYYDWTVPSGSDDDGVFTVKIWAQDNASNYLNPYPTFDGSKSIDNTAPSVSAAAVLSPNGYEAWSGMHSILWASDDITDLHFVANPITLFYSNNGGGSWNQIASFLANNGSYSWNTTSVPDGSNYLIRILAVDFAGNIGYDISNATFTVDNTVPGCSIVYNQSMVYLKDGMKLKVFANFTEGSAGMDEASVRISIDTAGNGSLANVSMVKSDNTHWFYGWVVPAGSDDDGTVAVRVWGQDNASNYLNPYPTINTIKIIDNTAPDCSIEYNLSKTFFNVGDAIKIYANFTETESGINESSVKINIDTAGNGGLANTSMVRTNNTDWYYGWTIPAGSDDDGAFTVKIWAHDNISNYVNPYPTTNAIKKIDNTRPICTIAYNRSAFTFKAGTKLKIYANFSELGSGINPSSVIIGITTAGDGAQSPIAMSQTNNTRWYYSWTIPSGSDDDGIFTVSIWASDNESNQLNPVQTTDSSKLIDNTAPICTIAYNRSATYFKEGDKSKIYVNFTEFDSGMDESSLKISFETVGNGDLANTSMTKIDDTHYNYEWMIPAGSDDDGAVTVRVWVKDNAGNLLSPYPTTSTTKQIDNTAPSVPAYALKFPNGGEQISGIQTIAWGNGDITDSHLAASPITLFYSNNGGASWVQITTGEANDGEYSLNVGTLADGSNYKINVLAADQAGNTANDTSNATFTIDNTNPTCSIFYNQSGIYFMEGSNLKIYANFTEADSGINDSSVKVSITTIGNGGLANTSMVKTDSTHWYYDWTAPSGSDDDGVFTVKIWAHDNVSKALIPWPTTDSSRQIDNTAPLISSAMVLTPNGGEMWSGTHSLTWVSGDITDSHLAASPITLFYSNNGGGSWVQIATGEANDGEYSLNVGTLADGSNYKINVLAADQAGNVANDTSNETFAIDNTPPTCSIGYNRTETSFKQGATIKIFANFTEITSGMNETMIQINISTSGSGGLSNTTLHRISSTQWYYNWTIPSEVDDDGTFIVKIYAKDNASNNLDAYPTINTAKQIDNTAPTSALNAIISHYHDTSTYLTITASASDVLSGLDTVSLFFYNSTDNFTWAGPYRYAINATPWNGVSWNFSFLSTNNSGYYRFYSEATDNATNIETAPITNDTWCLYNFTNSPPNASKNPSPAIGATDVSISITLSWMSGGDPDENTVTYDVYFGTDSTPDATELKIRNQTTTSYNPGTLSYGTTYYWLIISRDNHSIGTVGPIWSFNTATAPQNPGGEYISYPGNIRPVADVGDFYSGYLNETITFNGSKSKDSDGSIVGYRWDFTNDSIYDTAWLTSAIITHTYTHIGTYRVKLQVKDNENTTDDDTATITIKPHPFINVSQDSITQIKNTFGLHLTTPFYATDTNGDGIVDTFIDPNHLLTLVRFVNINENASFLISTENDMIPEFFWDTKANKTVPLTFIPVLMTETWINPEAQEILIIADVEKSEWVYLKIIDPYPPGKYQNFTLTVKTTDDRIISSNMIWRENGNIYFLDDPSVQYILTYGYTIFPPKFNPSDGTILNTARPTITITFLEETILAIATLENNNILDQLTTIDHKTYIFTPPSDLVDGMYTLRLTAQDAEGNTLTSTSTYTINILKIQTGEIPWLNLIFIAIILSTIIILFILRRRLII